MDFEAVGLKDLARARGMEAHAILTRVLHDSHPLTCQVIPARGAQPGRAAGTRYQSLFA